MEIGTMMDYTLHGTQKSDGGSSYEFFREDTGEQGDTGYGS